MGPQVASVKKTLTLINSILDIDMQGVKSVKYKTTDARFLFVTPPSVADLEKRLRGRGVLRPKNPLPRDLQQPRLKSSTQNSRPRPNIGQ